MTFTFDTGMLIALERRKPRATGVFRAIIRRGMVPVVPAVVFAEWWRGRSDLREEILAVVAKHISLEPDKVQVRMDRGDPVSTLEVDIEIPNQFDLAVSGAA